MPFDRDVTIDFNADISGYSASMAQMIQQTSQYTAAADGMIGKIAKLNNVVMAGVKSLSAFTQTNKVATAQAAAYQQQLSKIETSAKVTGKSFRELEKTTKGLAKDFPIGMKQAVEQVESLQEAGVTTNKEINSLAKTFTKLGAATGTFGPELGKNMLQLNRTFENGTDSMEKYADSLTTVTHQYGANAGAVTAFAKSIAPVAATVGMNETSVIGLSTAFSRLGEDGFAAANTFNKVMLDMSKSIREGTPEAKIYAEVMGTTSDNLKQAWESNPAEGFIDFVEAIKAQGTGGIRSLEQLGLEGVRTQKTIMALANSGNMREIVAKAQSSYGSGTTGTAAETAMGGVNDQLTMLNETMAQTTATAGKPFLGFLEKVLGVANSISKVFADLVESPVVQGLAKAIGVAGGIWGVTKMMNSVAPTMAFVQNMVAKLWQSGPMRGFVSGRARPDEVTGASPLSERVGGFMSRTLGISGGESMMTGLRRGAGRISNVGGNMAAAWFRAQESEMRVAMGEARLQTPEGQRLSQAFQSVTQVGTSGLSWRERRKVMKQAVSEGRESLAALAEMEGGVGRAAKGYLSQSKTSARYLAFTGRAAMSGLGQVGSAAAGAVGIGGLGATAAAGLGAGALVAGAGYAYYKSQKNEEEARERGGKDAYRMFNEFAEKAGLATKGLVSFSEALAESTSKIVGASKTREEAFEITAEERIAAKTPGYEPAYESRGNAFWDKVFPSNLNPEKEALRVRGILGPDASKESINQMQVDLIAQHGETFTQQVFAHYTELDKLSTDELKKRMVEAGEKSKVGGFYSGVEASEYVEAGEAEVARRAKMETDIKGTKRVEAERFAAAEPLFGEAMAVVSGPHRRKESEEAIDKFVSSLVLNSDDTKALTKAMNDQRNEGKSLPEMMRIAGLDALATNYQQGLISGPAAGAGEYKNLTPEQLKAMSISPGEEAAKESASRYASVGLAFGTLGTDMADTARVVRESGLSLEDWTAEVNAGTRQATDMQKAWANLEMAPGDVDKQTKMATIAANEAIRQAKETYGGGTATALQINAAAMTTSTSAQMPALQQASQIIQQMSGQTDASMSKWKRMQETVDIGQRAGELLQGPKAAGLTAEEREIATQQQAQGLQTQDAWMQEMKQFNIAQARQMEDFNKQKFRMNQQYEEQTLYAQQDFARQRQFAQEDYQIGVLQAEEDFHTQRMRAQRDFDKQVKRQAEQTAKNMFDPYQRIAPQIVTSIDMLQQSLLEQNKSVSDQLSSVGKLSKMGLSKDAIDQLKLMDPQQNQQVQRLLSDARTDPGAIQKINDLITKRMKLGYKLNTSEFNKDFENMKEDFGQSMEDMGDDYERAMKRGESAFRRSMRRNGEVFATAQSRAAAAHEKALTQMEEDNAEARTRSYEDLTGLSQDYTDSYTEIETKFLQDMANLPSNLSKSTKDLITKILKDKIDAIEEANDDISGAASRPVYGPSSAWAMGSGTGGGGPIDPGTARGGGDTDLANFFLQRIGDQKMIGLGAGHDTPTWHEVANACLMNVAWAKRYLGDTVKHSGYPTAASVGNALRSERQMYSGYSAPAGALYWWDSGIGGGAGHVAVSDGRGHAINNWGSRQVEIHDVRGMASGSYMGWTPYSALAEGGIVAGPTRALVGEAGREAIIPLNDKGTRYLADAMSEAARYWQPTSAAGTRSQGYSAPVTNNVYTYDQRTQFMGEVSVQSQDPEEMARKLAARERRNRLARKTGSAA